MDELEAKAATMRTVLSQLVDADKDVDTEVGVLDSSTGCEGSCDSPPPLPSLIFDSQLSNMPAGLLGSDPLINHHQFQRSVPVRYL